MEGRDRASLFLLPEEFPVGPNGVHADADGDGTEPQSVHVHLLRNFCCPTLWELLSISFLRLPVKEGTLRAAGIAEGSGVDSVQGKGGCGRVPVGNSSLTLQLPCQHPAWLDTKDALSVSSVNSTR